MCGTKQYSIYPIYLDNNCSHASRKLAKYNMKCEMRGIRRPRQRADSKPGWERSRRSSPRLERSSPTAMRSRRLLAVSSSGLRITRRLLHARHHCEKVYRFRDRCLVPTWCAQVSSVVDVHREMSRSAAAGLRHFCDFARLDGTQLQHQSGTIAMRCSANAKGRQFRRECGDSVVDHGEVTNSSK
jgi:hypothetical protein